MAIKISDKLKQLIITQIPDPNTGTTDHMFLSLLEEIVEAINDTAEAVEAIEDELNE